MIAAVMCGGRGKRIASPIEKPLIQVGGKPMVERVILALIRSCRFEQVIAVVSPNTPRTKDLLSSKGISVIEKSGNGFSLDLSFLDDLISKKVLVVPADLPLLNSDLVEMILDLLAPCSAPAASAVATIRFAEKIGVKPSVTVEVNGTPCCHSGITLFDTLRLQEGPIGEKYVLIEQKEIVVNVNTKSELEIAERLLVEGAEHLAKDRCL